MRSAKAQALVFAMLPLLPVLAEAKAPVVVSGARTAQTADEVLVPVSVITREEIEKFQVNSVQELIRATPGVAVTNNGGQGKISSVFLRGTESDHVLVLIDGVKVGSATAGTTPFEFLPVEQIERVEIVRGPRSHLYGSEAIGGVIQIFTRKGGDEFTPSISLGGGSFGSSNASLGLSGGGEQGWFNFGVSAEDTDGYNSCTGEPMVAGCFTDEPDDDGHNSVSTNMRIGYRFDNDMEVDFHWLNTQNETEFDGSFQNYTETEQDVLGLSFKTMLGDNTLVDVKAGRSKDLSDNYLDDTFASRFDTQRDSLSAQATYFAGDDHTILGGVDYRDDSVTSSTAYTISERDNTGLFVQYLGSFGERDVQVGIRNDDDEQFGGKTTGGITLGQQLPGGHQLTLAYGTAYKAPSFNELYFPGFGNPDLEPEESESFELGLSGSHWSVNLYNTEIDQMIGFDPVTYAAVNIDSARIRGLEVAGRRSLAEWDLAATLTLLDPENRASGNEGHDLPRRARESLRLDADRDFGRYSAGVSLVAEGKKYDDLANTREIDSYVTVDLRAAAAVGKDWSLLFKVQNLFDESYETASYYPQAERSFFLTLRYTPTEK